MEIDSEKCVLCDNNVVGEVESVRLTLCCAKCCKKSGSSYNNVYKGRYRTSKTRAMTDYGCTHSDLSMLNYETQPNPVDVNGRPMKLYLKAEAEYLGTKRREMQLEEQTKRERGAIIGKKSALELHLGVNLTKMDRVLRRFLLGDYLSKGAETKTTLEDVTARYAALNRVTEILQTCPLAHPEAAFSFCLEHPDCGPTEFQALKDKVRDVFRLEGARIFHKLPDPKYIESSLKNTPLQDVYAEFVNRDSRAIVRGHLIKWCSEQTADQIMSHSACQDRLKRNDDEEIVAEKLIEYWNEKDDRNKRTERLKAEFEFRKVPWMQNFVLCESYISGEIDCDAVEIVATKQVFGLLVEPSKVCQCDRVSKVRRRLVECLYGEKMGYMESVEQVSHEIMTVQQHVFVYEPHYFYEDIDDIMSIMADSWDEDSLDYFESSGSGSWIYSDDEDMF